MSHVQYQPKTQLMVVPLPEAATDEAEFGLLVKWLESYNPKHLFNTDVKNDSTRAHAMGASADAVIDEKALRIIPKDQKRRMGMVDVRDLASCKDDD